MICAAICTHIASTRRELRYPVLPLVLTLQVITLIESTVLSIDMRMTTNELYKL